MNRRLRVVVMMGGFSAERDVSLRSGLAVAAALRSLGHDVVELDVRGPDWELPPDVDVVFLALHGTYGEDGTVQRRLDELGVVYTGSDAESSRLAFDKVLTKERCVRAGIPTPRFAVLEDPRVERPAWLGGALVLKPARQGSSVGLQFVDEPGEWPRAVQEAFKYDTKVVVEERICGREVTVGILGGDALPVVEVRPRSGRYDYQSKYTAGATEYVCPARFDAEQTARIQGAALAVFGALGCRDYGRVDIMVGPDDVPYVLEVNTLPGMTATSLLPKAAAAAGLSYERLCERMLELALARAGVRR